MCYTVFYFSNIFNLQKNHQIDYNIINPLIIKTNNKKYLNYWNSFIIIQNYVSLRKKKTSKIT